MMPDTVTQDEPAPAVVGDSPSPVAPEPRWPARMAFLTSWLLPATSARRLAHVSLPKAFLVHLASAVLLWLLIDAGEAWESDRHGFGHLTGEAIEEIVEEFARDPVEVGVVLGGIVLCVEGGYLVLAALVGCWGAADEKIRSSFRHALRCVWLLSPHVLPITIVVFMVAVELTIARREWYQAVQALPFPNAAEYPTTQAFQEAVQTYRLQWQNGWNQSPWYFRYDEEILGYLSFASGAWALWAMLRAVGSRRDPPWTERPPMCEFCGYNLSMARLEGRCPECGHPVSESLGPAARQGPPWEHRDRLGIMRAWWRCTVDPIVRPAWFGRQIRVASPRTDHRLFLLTHMALMGLIGYAGVLLVYGLAEGDPFADNRMATELRWIVAPMSGYVTAGFALVFGLLAAGLVALRFRWPARRNLSPAAMQMACYLGGFGTLWTLFALAVAAVIVPLAEAGWYDQWQSSLWIDDEVLVLGSFVAPNLVMLLVYLHLLVKGTAAARYANR